MTLLWFLAKTLAAFWLASTLLLVIVVSFYRDKEEQRREERNQVLTSLHQSAARDMVQEGYQAHTEHIAAEIHRREAEGDVWVPESGASTVDARLKVPHN